MILPHVPPVYERAASALDTPQLLDMLRDGAPVYAWPYEERQVWTTTRTPLAIRTVKKLTSAVALVRPRVPTRETCNCSWQHGGVSAPERDPAEVARVLLSWFDRVRGFADVEVANVSIPGGTGFSNETILFDATWSDGGVAVKHELVARVAPSSYQVFPDDTFELQFHVMRALDATDVPVAAVHWFEPDEAWFGKPFWIMARVHGDIPTDNPPYACAGWLADATPANRRACG